MKNNHYLMRFSFIAKLVMFSFLFLGMSSMLSYAQEENNLSISGKIIDKISGEPLIGVSVMEKGTFNGTTTNAAGIYSIKVTASSVLEITYLGYKTIDAYVGKSTKMDFQMEEDSQKMDEVVFIGYGVQKKKLSTGATAQIGGDAIQQMNSANPLQAMQGQVPGITIMSESGQPGSALKVTIRGLGTVGDASPLYLIDGVPGDITILNPSDIASVDVLKDAASAAIYGAQAANGVVLITTRGGEKGRTHVTFNGYRGIQNVPRTTNMLNASQYMAIMDESNLNSGAGDYDWASKSSIWDKNGNVYDTDWVKEMFKDNAVVENYSVGVTGGNDKSVYSMSIGYFNQEGIVGGSDVSNYERYNFRMNSEHNLLNNFMKVGEHMSFIYTKSNGIGVGDQYNNTLRTAFQTSPIVPIYSDNNIYDSPYNDTSKSDWYTGDGNPYGAMMTENNNLTTSNGFAADAYAAISPIKGLTVKTDFAVNFSNSSYRSYTEKYQFSLYDYNTSATSVSQNMSHNLSMTSTTTASYDFNIQKHEISALAGIESYRYQGEYVGGSSRYLKNVFDSWQYAYIDNTEATNADDFSTSGHPEDDVRRISYFGRLSWNYDETFMANATLRADGSSRFANGHRWGYFPSVSAGWVITNHSWMKSTKSWLTFLKLRASWGQVGNQNIDNFQFVSPVTMTYTNYVFGTGLGSDQNVWGAYPSRLANDNIKWETSEQTDIGFDAVLFKNLRFNADYYYKKTKDWLVEAPILGIAGTGAPYINGGDVKNTGCEFSVNWNDTFSNGFNYSISANVSYNKNKVGNIPTEDGIIHGRSNMLYDNSTEFYRAQNGYPIGYFWGYKTAGIFQSQADIDAWKAAGKGILQGNVKPGDVKYVDVDNSGTIGDPDKVNLGNGMPDWTFGFTISLNYKNFDFSAVANGMTGNKIVQSYRNQARSTQNYTTAILRRWTGEGTSNKYPRVTNSNVNWDFSDLYVHDGDFLRISNITLGYDFAPLCRFKYLTKARLYFQVQNAFTFTKYDGMDPEIGYGMDDWVSGVDLGYYPRPRTCMIGVNLTF